MIEQIAERIRERVAALGSNQTDTANALGWSQQRFGNYYHGRRMPDIPSLVRIAKSLGTSLDWLTGLSDERSSVDESVLRELLKASGMPQVRVSLILDARKEALRILSALSDEGFEPSHTRSAALAAWHTANSPRPN